MYSIHWMAIYMKPVDSIIHLPGDKQTCTYLISLSPPVFLESMLHWIIPEKIKHKSLPPVWISKTKDPPPPPPSYLDFREN